MHTTERRRFRFGRQSEDADIGMWMTARVKLSLDDEAPPVNASLAAPWTCEPCGTRNNEGSRLNCAYCGRERAE
jgi:hypothetical protein